MKGMNLAESPKKKKNPTIENPATSFVPCIAPPHPTHPSPSVSLRRQKRYSNAISLLKSLSGLSLLTLSHPSLSMLWWVFGDWFWFMGFSLNEFNGFLRSDFDEGLMGFWGLILVYGFLNFFFFFFLCWIYGFLIERGLMGFWNSILIRLNSCEEFEWVGEIDGYGFEQFVQSVEFGGSFGGGLGEILWQWQWFLWCLNVLAKMGLRCGDLGFWVAVKGLGIWEVRRTKEGERELVAEFEEREKILHFYFFHAWERERERERTLWT